MTYSVLDEVLDPRQLNSHKGDYGRLVTLCGATGMLGAAALCAKAAYRSGVGLVEMICAPENYPILQTMVPEAIFSMSDDVAQLAKKLSSADACVVGCGMHPAHMDWVSSSLMHVSGTLVMDAEALNQVAHDLRLLDQRQQPTILTPHPKEMARLCQLDVRTVQAQRTQRARAFAQDHHCVVVLKGYQTVVAGPDGRLFTNSSGNPGMATAGSGDVLSGVIGAFAARHKDPFICACAGVLAHGMAGDLAAKRMSMTSLIASDLIDSLPEVFLHHER